MDQTTQRDITAYEKLRIAEERDDGTGHVNHDNDVQAKWHCQNGRLGPKEQHTVLP